MAQVVAREPHGVICLLSALRFHGLTSQHPHEVWLAIPPGAWERMAFKRVRIRAQESEIAAWQRAANLTDGGNLQAYMTRVLDESAGVPEPSVRYVRFSGKAFSQGIELHAVGNTHLRVYSAAKTVADCFKYRNKIGLDVAIEALRDYWRLRKGTIDDLLHYAAICRVANVLRPYLESLVA